MKISRLLSIILILLEKTKVNAAYLAEKFEVSTRTIYRDMATINESGIPIVSQEGVDGGFSILPQYKIDKKIFTMADITAMLAGLESVAKIISPDDLQHALIKLHSLIPNDKQKLIHVKSRQITIDTAPWHFKRPHEEITLIKKALFETRLLELEYRKASGEFSRRTIEPYQLVLKENKWYLYAYCLLRHDFRWFKLARMKKVRVLAIPFSQKEFTPSELKATECKHMIVATLTINENLYEVIYTDYGVDRIKPLENGTYKLDLHMPDDNTGYDTILSFGTDCLDIQPQKLKEKIKNRAKQLYENYR